MVAYSFKRQFIGPITVGLGLPSPNNFGVTPPDIRPKRQTVRAGVIRRDGDAWSKVKGGRRHARSGEELQLYYGMRTRSCRLIGEARCTAVWPVILWFTAGSIAAMIDGKLLTPRKMAAFAVGDGFKDALEMAAFWSHENGTRDGDKWSGVLITWEPL